MNDKILIDRAVVERALEALKNTTPAGFNMESDKRFYLAIDSLSAALEQEHVDAIDTTPERVDETEKNVHEPVAWMYEEAKYRPTDLRGQQWLPALSRERPYFDKDMVRNLKPLYTAPPQRERVQFPTMLRKMWSGSEVQAWLDENVNKEGR